MKKILIAGVAATAIGLSALSASAATITFNGFYNGLSRGVDVDVTTPAKSYNGSGGAFSVNAGAGDFIAWCLDLYEFVGGAGYTPVVTDNDPSTWTGAFVDPTPANAPDNWVLGAAREEDLRQYFNYNYSSALSDKNHAAAFQLGLWEIVYETVGNAVSLASGNFQGTVTGLDATNTTEVLDIAAEYLLNLTKAAFAPPSLGGQVYQLTFWDSNGAHQDLVSGELVSYTTPEVPLPAPLLLLGSGLIGLFGFSRFKNTAKATV